MTIRYLVAKNTVDEMIWTLIDRKLDVLGHALDGKDDKQEVTVLEGRTDAENCIDTFLRGILDVVDTYDERKDAWNEAREARKKARANPGAVYLHDPLFDDSTDGYDFDGNGNGGAKRKKPSRGGGDNYYEGGVGGNEDDGSGSSDVEWNRGDDTSNDGFEWNDGGGGNEDDDDVDVMGLPTKKMKPSRKGSGGSGGRSGGGRRYSPKPIPVFVNGEAGDPGDEEGGDRRSQLISPRKLGSFPRAATARTSSVSPGISGSSRSGSASPMYQNRDSSSSSSTVALNPTSSSSSNSTISSETKAKLSARFEEFFNT